MSYVESVIDTTSIVAAITGSGGTAAVMYLWIKDLRAQLKRKDDAAETKDTAILGIVKEQAAVVEAVRDRLRRIEYALELRCKASDEAAAKVSSEG